MLDIALWTVYYAGAEVVGLLGDGVGAAVEAFFAGEVELVGGGEGFAGCDGFFVGEGAVSAVGERFGRAGGEFFFCWWIRFR